MNPPVGRLLLGVALLVPLTTARVSLLEGPANRAAAAEAAGANLQPGDALPRGRSVDALPYVALDWDVVSGAWRRDEDGLTTEPSKMSRVMLPFEIQGDYDIEAEFTRTEGEGSIDFVLPVGQRACELSLAGWWQTMHGLWRIDGRDPRDHDNPAKFRPGKLFNKRSYRVLISVRTEKDGASITVSLDGKPIIAWTGRQSSLSVPPYMAMPHAMRAGFGAYDSTATFHSVKLRSVSGKTPLAARPAPPFKYPGGDHWVDLLAGVEPDRNAVHGRWVRLDQAIAVAPASADEGFVRLMLPDEVEGSYNLAVEFTRVRGSESIVPSPPLA